jgi:hypothetical protein
MRLLRGIVFKLDYQNQDPGLFLDRRFRLQSNPVIPLKAHQDPGTVDIWLTSAVERTYAAGPQLIFGRTFNRLCLEGNSVRTP